MTEYYTPTTDEMRWVYVRADRAALSREEYEAEFDRWLAKRDAEVAAKAVSDAVELAEKSQSFWALVDIQGAGNCWLWMGSRRGEGDAYGGFAGTTAHRYSWALHNARWPERWQVVRHKCDNGLCVNPRHLEVGTQSENVRDMAERSRGWWQRGLCRNGHVQSDDNTHVYPNGKRECIDCRTLRRLKAPHYGSKLKTCEVCGKSMRSGNMARHLRTHGEPSNPYRKAAHS